MSNYRLGGGKVTYLTLAVVSEEGLPHRFCSRGKFPVQESLASSTVTRPQVAPGAPPPSRPFSEQGSDREGICHLVPHQWGMSEHWAPSQQWQWWGDVGHWVCAENSLWKTRVNAEEAAPLFQVLVHRDQALLVMNNCILNTDAGREILPKEQQGYKLISTLICQMELGSWRDTSANRDERAPKAWRASSGGYSWKMAIQYKTYME